MSRHDPNSEGFQNLRQPHKDKGQNPIQHKESPKNDYSPIEKFPGGKDSSPPLGNYDQTQAIYELKDNIKQGQQSQPVMHQAPTYISVRSSNDWSGETTSWTGKAG